jgi:hypothetical protein
LAVRCSTLPWRQTRSSEPCARTESRPQTRVNSIARELPDIFEVRGIHAGQSLEQPHIDLLRLSKVGITRLGQHPHADEVRNQPRRDPQVILRASWGPITSPGAQWFTAFVQVVIRGHRLPGRTFRGDEAWDNVHVALQVGRDPAGLVPGDADSATWRAEVTIVERDGFRDFRGPAVQGKKGERFLYLTWGQIDSDSKAFTMFRRAKLLLDDVPALETSPATVVASVDLTDDRGCPRCGRLKPPAIQWEPQAPSTPPLPAV